ncbi:hypothetical protein H012_gp641 [Acanthamoeba polyphaga moumouvirus]|uniref:Uncharacterized protein n=2 Tax=Moumouvirus TaxID=3080801 RepID=L7RCR2_9VIRU|nr:hypothetical protein H012_gp641 [Acanthamoeba polyphaga moumouvirus]AEX62966.1 hypothetical protein mv_L762 [Moumouvirus Monve]AGC01823.1 hypothetical protein Moumou_00281 [Acanthamoeba polyphaga moumouvirus]AQN68179.1 hypothetical protein [Saudi moumouvirus]
MNVLDKILSTPLSSQEFSEAYDKVIYYYGGNDNDWYIVQETEDLAYDCRLVKHGLKPKFSDIFREYPQAKKPTKNNDFTLDACESGSFGSCESIESFKSCESIGSFETMSESASFDDVEIINIKELDKPLPLPDPIALIAEWQINGHWTTDIVTVMETVQEFWNFMHNLQQEDNTSCKFSMPLQGMESLADKIFSELISSGRSRGDHVVIDKNLQNRVNAIVANYNSLHPVWSFIKVSELGKKNNIQVPFIRKNHRAVNDININLKDTKFNSQRNIYTMNKSFTEGYIPFLVFDFIRGQLPDDIRAIVFNKTIAVHGNSYFKGFRVRVLTKTDESSCLMKCKNYLENHFIENHSSFDKDYTQCVVRISLPK